MVIVQTVDGQLYIVTKENYWANVELLKLKKLKPLFKGSIAGKKVLFDDYDDFLGMYSKNGNKIEYINPKGNLLKWSEQHPTQVQQKINSNLEKLPTTGEYVEGYTAKYLQDNGIVIESTGAGITNMTIKKPAGDVDILTLKSIIEVKKNYSSFKLEQVDKFVDITNINYFNPFQRKAVLYIQDAMDVQQKTAISNQIPNNVTLVNSLAELLQIIK